MSILPPNTQRLFAQIIEMPRRSLIPHFAAMLGRVDLPSRRELAGLRPATRLMIVALLVWIGFVVLATAMAVAWSEMSALNFSSWFGSGAAASASTEIRSPTAFENILQRPLFSRDRHAPSEEKAAMPMPAPMLDQSLTLKGVFISGDLAKAFMTFSQNPIGIWVQTGEEIAGWQVVAVKPDQVLLSALSKKLAVPLSINGGPK